MKINDQGAFFNLKARTQRSHKSSRPSVAATMNTKWGRMLADKVVFSPRARELQDAMVQLIGLPDVDTRRVAQIQLQIENGTYRIDGGRIAEGMLEEMQLNFSL